MAATSGQGASGAMNPGKSTEPGETNEEVDAGGGKAIGVECCDKMFVDIESAEAHERRHLISTAAEASETFGDDELERYAARVRAGRPTTAVCGCGAYGPDGTFATGDGRGRHANWCAVWGE